MLENIHSQTPVDLHQCRTQDVFHVYRFDILRRDQLGSLIHKTGRYKSSWLAGYALLTWNARQLVVVNFVDGCDRRGEVNNKCPFVAFYHYRDGKQFVEKTEFVRSFLANRLRRCSDDR